MKTSNKVQLKEEITYLEAILSQLNEAKTLVEKIRILDGTDKVKNTLDARSKAIFDKMPLETNMLFKTMIIIGQAPVLFAIIRNKEPTLKKLVNILKEIDEFYESCSGLIMYQLCVLKLILENKEIDSQKKTDSSVKFLKPVGVDLSKDCKEVRQLIRYGIENFDTLGEIYPVGGAGERLKLSDPITHEYLPVATLPFLGRSLLEGLIRDLEGREFLYYKLTGKQLITPVAMMTSEENENIAHIETLCRKNNWFKRSKEMFFNFIQPMVPVNTIEGQWLLSTPNNLMLKPSGHGVIWKLAVEKGVFEWFKKKNRKKLVSRQINNPIAGVDSGLLGFTGVGLKGKYLFGFLSCDRIIKTSEGMDILIETQTKSGFEYKITNIEYTELIKNGIEDTPEVKSGQFSKFPANTNILFLDIENIETIIKRCPIPGMLINMKTEIPYVASSGLLKKIKAGRLESTMQNAADAIISTFSKKLDEEQYSHLSTYLTYNKRNKTISVTKKSFVNRDSFAETPESCFYDVCKINHELFSENCKMELPEVATVDDYLKNGPSVMITYHPALGPNYCVIAQKIRHGKILKNSELNLEIAEVDIDNLELDGSLVLVADNIAGSVGDDGVIQYGKNLGKCTLTNVKVKNQGIDREAPNQYWSQNIKRLEAFTIKIHGNGELIAENITIEGNLEVEVMDNERLIMTSNAGELIFKREKLKSSDQYWQYAFDSEDRIVLNRI